MNTPIRFWSKVAIKGKGDCWEWQGCKYGTFGYGAFSVKGKTWLAHRLAWSLSNGSIPDGAVIRHSCDNPKCCNPAHLLIGTHADNVRDRLERRGDQKGEHNYSAKLVEVDVRNLRYRAYLGSSYRDLARDYGISQSLVSMIVSGRVWKHTFKPDMVPVKNRKLTCGQKDEIRLLWKSGMVGQRALASKFRVSQAYVSKIVRGAI